MSCSAGEEDGDMRSILDLGIWLISIVVPTELRVIFGGVSLFCFVVSIFGKRVDFRWANWRFRPMMPNWMGRLYFGAFGLVFGLVAAFAK
jgi:hypothetical protein